MVASAFETTIVIPSYVKVLLTGLHQSWLNAFAMHARGVRNNKHGFHDNTQKLTGRHKQAIQAISVADCAKSRHIR